MLPELVAAGSLGAIDVVSVRLWLDRYVAVADPANVFARFGSLQGAGATFMLDQLQNADQDALWGGGEPQGSVVASDFYNATAIAALNDQEIVDTLLDEFCPRRCRAFGLPRCWSLRCGVTRAPCRCSPPAVSTNGRPANIASVCGLRRRLGADGRARARCQGAVPGKGLRLRPRGRQCLDAHWGGDRDGSMRQEHRVSHPS